jgi:ribonuclease HII
VPDLTHEQRLGGVVAGIDEAGRGPLAGPVVAAAVVLPARLPAILTERLDDSKKLTATRREALYEVIAGCAAVGVGIADVDEIDRINILRATFAAMGRALTGLGMAVDVALVDGNQKPPLACRVECLVGGDGLSLSIAAASIIAKVTRDRLMLRLAEQFPGYGWERNMGYGTAEHRAALTRLGPTPHHRRSFAPVADLFDGLTG